MRGRISLIIMCLTILAVTALLSAGDRPWFDMQNCVFCKPWMESGLMKEMAHNQYNISNGVMMICSVPKARMADYKKACAQMDALGKRAAAGEKLVMCQSCEMMGGFMARGAKMEEVWTDNGSVMLLTASDTKMVEEMHKWSQRNNEEGKKMMSAAAPER